MKQKEVKYIDRKNYLALKHTDWAYLIDIFKKYNIGTKTKDIIEFIRFFDNYKKIDINKLLNVFEEGLKKAYKKYSPTNNGHTKHIINIRNILIILETKDNYEEVIESLLNLDKELSIFTTNTKSKINSIINH